MHIHHLHQRRQRHSHNFHVDDGRGERNTRRVILLTILMMTVEITAGFRLGSYHDAAIISIVTHLPKPPEYYKDLLVGFEKLEHVTTEVNTCEGEPCMTTA